MTTQRVRFPAAVAEFLRANPGYTRKFAGLKLAPEEAYFRHRVLKDWAMVAPHVDPAARTVLDIGCGIAGIDLLVHRALSAARLVLVDKASREEGRRTYDVLAAAREFLTANGVPDEDIVPVSSQSDDVHARVGREKVDLALSLRGLGYMFPYETYRRTLLKVCRPGSRLVLDVRLMGSATLKTSAVIFERFRKVGMPTEDAVISRLRGDFGRVEELGRSRDYVRVLVTRTRAGRASRHGRSGRGA